MGKIIAIANQKGGVGKTTTSVNLAACLGDLGKKTLLIDMDPQGNASSGFGVDKRTLSASSYELVMGDIKAEDAVIITAAKNVSIIPSNINLAGAEIELAEKQHRADSLKTSLLALRHAYDFILIDCPPSLGLVTLNALTAADTVLIPIQCEFYALEGLSQLCNTIKQVKNTYNPELDIEGVLFTMYDSRLILTAQVAAEVKKFFPSKVYKTCIPRNVRLSEAPSHGKPVIYYDKSSKGAESYKMFAKEFLKGGGGRK